LTALDPTRAVGSGDPGPQIYNTLVETRGCRYGDPVMAPSLAKSWDISPDGLTYTLHLNPAGQVAKPTARERSSVYFG
jgi:ABC-type transport system substrate-binding protein